MDRLKPFGVVAKEAFVPDEKYTRLLPPESDDLTDDDVERFLSVGKELIDGSCMKALGLGSETEALIASARANMAAAREMYDQFDEAVDVRGKRREDARKRRAVHATHARLGSDDEKMKKRAEYIHHLMVNTAPKLA